MLLARLVSSNLTPVKAVKITWRLIELKELALPCASPMSRSSEATAKAKVVDALTAKETHLLEISDVLLVRKLWVTAQAVAKVPS